MDVAAIFLGCFSVCSIYSFFSGWFPFLAPLERLVPKLRVRTGLSKGMEGDLKSRLLDLEAVFGGGGRQSKRKQKRRNTEKGREVMGEAGGAERCGEDGVMREKRTQEGRTQGYKPNSGSRQPSLAIKRWHLEKLLNLFSS